MRRSTFVAAGIGGALLVAAGIGVASFGSTDHAAASPAVVIAQGDDRLPSTTASDWVTYADHVVVVTAGPEQAGRPTQTEVERGEGLIGRKIALQVKDVLWSRPGAAQPAPKAWDYNATGWVFADGDQQARKPVALHDRPRVETGHQYILAIAWEGAQCVEGEAQPGHWIGLGEGSELPYDGDRIGQGEYEGKVRTLAEAQAVAKTAAATGELEDALVGSSAKDLVAQLTSAVPAQRQLPARPKASC